MTTISTEDKERFEVVGRMVGVSYRKEDVDGCTSRKRRCECKGRKRESKRGGPLNISSRVTVISHCTSNFIPPVTYCKY